jgi:flagellar basal-body rod protein FlgB
MLQDISIDALQAAMHGLSAREKAISNNIANVNTPYFTAREVSFEDQLSRALEAGEDPSTAGISARYTTDAAGLNGNNVDLNAQTLLGIETKMKMELALRATGDRFTLMRSAVRGG